MKTQIIQLLTLALFTFSFYSCALEDTEDPIVPNIPVVDEDLPRTDVTDIDKDHAFSNDTRTREDNDLQHNQPVTDSDDKDWEDGHSGDYNPKDNSSQVDAEFPIEDVDYPIPPDSGPETTQSGKGQSSK